MGFLVRLRRRSGLRDAMSSPGSALREPFARPAGDAISTRRARRRLRPQPNPHPAERIQQDGQDKQDGTGNARRTRFQPVARFILFNSTVSCAGFGCARDQLRITYVRIRRGARRLSDLHTTSRSLPRMHTDAGPSGLRCWRCLFTSHRCSSHSSVAIGLRWVAGKARLVPFVLLRGEAQSGILTVDSPGATSAHFRCRDELLYRIAEGVRSHARRNQEAV